MAHPRSLFVLSVLALGGLVGHATAASIDHTAIGCVVAEQFPRFDARLTPADAIGRARVFFRSDGGPAWYAVQMKQEGDRFTAALPKPKKSLRKFNYYVEVADKSLATSRTEEYTTDVVSGKGGCSKGMMGAAMSVASVLLEAPAGAAVIPVGFSSAGVVAAGSTATAAGGTAAVSSGGGGLGTGAIVVGTGVLAAAGAAGAYVALKDEAPAEVSGQVFATFDVNPSGPVGYRNPVVGATVSSSLDSVTTTTDGEGRFRLVTQTPRKNNQCFTLTIRGAGLPTYSVNGDWGGSAGYTFSLTPQAPSQASRPCPAP